MTIAVARPIRIDAIRPPAGRSPAHRSPSRSRLRQATTNRRPYSSSSVLACSHQPSSVRSVGGSTPSSPAARRDARAERRRGRGRGCRGAPRSRPGSCSWCSSGPKLARLSMSASSRHIRTSVVSAAIWSASVWRRVARLGHLEQQAGREDALVVEPVEMGGLDARQLVDRWHAAMMPRLRGRREQVASIHDEHAGTRLGDPGPPRASRPDARRPDAGGRRVGRPGRHPAVRHPRHARAAGSPTGATRRSTPGTGSGG